MTLQSSVTLGLFRLTSKPQLCEKRTSTERPSVQQLLEQRLPRMYSVYAANSTWCFQAVASAWASKRGSPPDAVPVMLWAPLSISLAVPFGHAYPREPLAWPGCWRAAWLLWLLQAVLSSKERAAAAWLWGRGTEDAPRYRSRALRVTPQRGGSASGALKCGVVVGLRGMCLGSQSWWVISTASLLIGK